MINSKLVILNRQGYLTLPGGDDFSRGSSGVTLFERMNIYYADHSDRVSNAMKFLMNLKTFMKARETPPHLTAALFDAVYLAVYAPPQNLQSNIVIIK